MYNILLIVQILVSIGIIGLVLIQHGKGADAGAAFGGGASGTVFGSRGAGNFLSRSTAVLALVFFLNSMALAWLVTHQDGETASILDTVVPAQEIAPEVEVMPGDVPQAPDAAKPQAMSSDVPTAEEADTSSADDVPTNPSGGASDVPEAGVDSSVEQKQEVKE